MRSGYLLVVEDDPALGRMVARALQNCRMEVHIATGPATAWGFVNREGRAPATLITDVHLGSGDGRVLAGQLRQIYPKMPVILMSGGFESGSEPHAPGTGPQQFLQKPFSAGQLIEKLEDLLASRVEQVMPD